MTTNQPHPDPLPPDFETELRSIDDAIARLGDAARDGTPHDLADRVFFRSASLLPAEVTPVRPAAARFVRGRSVLGRLVAAASLGVAALVVAWSLNTPNNTATDLTAHGEADDAVAALRVELTKALSGLDRFDGLAEQANAVHALERELQENHRLTENVLNRPCGSGV